MNRLFIIVPCFNEEEVLPLSVSKLTEVVKSLISKGKISRDSGILLVNDGSYDRTWKIIEAENSKNEYVLGLNLSSNVGHQNALIAGLETVKDMCDMSVTIDADLQDDVFVIEKMVDSFIKGADVVFGVRSRRKSDSLFKRTTAHAFYKFMNRLGVKTVYNHADYRLLSKRAMKAVLEYKERNIFLRGIVSNIGFKTDTVYYERGKRAAGKSKYPFRKMASFALDGITSFSIKPINMIAILGAVIIVFSIAALIYALCSYIFGRTSPGWTSLIISIWFLGGVQLFAIGIVGQYIGKAYLESKQRPRYHIEKFLGQKNKDE